MGSGGWHTGVNGGGVGAPVAEVWASGGSPRPCSMGSWVWGLLVCDPHPGVLTVTPALRGAIMQSLASEGCWLGCVAAGGWWLCGLGVPLGRR